MEKFSSKFNEMLYESLFSQVENKLDNDMISLKRGILDLIEKSVENYSNIDKVKNFIDNFLKNQETLENFVENEDIFDFYFKYQNDIDENCNKTGFFNENPNQNNVKSLYDFIIVGTQHAVKNMMSIIKKEL